VYGALENSRADFTSEVARARMPTEVTLVEIPAGNYEQFGYHTGQPNDPAATTPRDEQPARVVGATLQLLASISRKQSYSDSGCVGEQTANHHRRDG
jgi:hypothetical protein